MPEWENWVFGMGTLRKRLANIWLNWQIDRAPEIFLAATVAIGFILFILTIALSALVLVGLDRLLGGPPSDSATFAPSLVASGVVVIWLVYRHRVWFATSA